jgi:hypothetical protein
VKAISLGAQHVPLSRGRVSYAALGAGAGRLAVGQEGHGARGPSRPNPRPRVDVTTSFTRRHRHGSPHAPHSGSVRSGIPRPSSNAC